MELRKLVVDGQEEPEKHWPEEVEDTERSWALADIHWMGIQMEWVDSQEPAGVGTRRIEEREDSLPAEEGRVDLDTHKGRPGEGRERDMRMEVVDLGENRRILWRADSQDFGLHSGGRSQWSALGEVRNGVVGGRVGIRAGVLVDIRDGLRVRDVHVRVRVGLHVSIRVRDDGLQERCSRRPNASGSEPAEL